MLEVEVDVFNKKRWRKSNPDNWDRNIQKKKRNSGQEYTTKVSSKINIRFLRIYCND